MLALIRVDCVCIHSSLQHCICRYTAPQNNQNSRSRRFIFLSFCIFTNSIFTYVLVQTSLFNFHFSFFRTLNLFRRLKVSPPPSFFNACTNSNAFYTLVGNVITVLVDVLLFLVIALLL